jgi:dihydropteroate synthase
MTETIASAGVSVIVMHMHGTPKTMQENTMSGNVVSQISEFFDAVCIGTADAGIGRNKVILDPGIGFGKTFRQNVEIMNNLRMLRKGCPLMTGTSMKAFLQYAYPEMTRRDASIRSAVECIRNGAHIVRVHDVKGTVRALKDVRLK